MTTLLSGPKAKTTKSFCGISKQIEKLLDNCSHGVNGVTCTTCGGRESSMSKLIEAIDGRDALTRCDETTLRQMLDADDELDERAREVKYRATDAAFRTLGKQ